MNKLREKIAMYTDTPRHVDNILALIKEAIGEPPVLNKEEMVQAVWDAGNKYEHEGGDLDNITQELRFKWIAKAQRDADVRYCEVL